MFNLYFCMDFLDSHSKNSLISIKSIYINNLIRLFLFWHQSKRIFFSWNCGFNLFCFHQNFMSMHKNVWELSVNVICNNFKFLQINWPICNNSLRCKLNISFKQFLLLSYLFCLRKWHLLASTKTHSLK